MRRALFLAVVVLMVSWSLAQADTVTIHFTEATSKAQGIFMDVSNSNDGSEKPVASFSGGQWKYQIYYFDLSAAGLVGATINGASFSATDNWSTDQVYDGVEARRINSPVTWDQGNGNWDNRWNNYSGAGKSLAQCTLDSDGNVTAGVDWAGNAVTWWGTHPITEVIADLIDTQNGFGTAVTFDVTTLVQNLADGTWDNDGFVISNVNAVDVTVGGNNQATKKLNNPTLLIDFTPIPEPATMLLLGTGILGVARIFRRRRV